MCEDVLLQEFLQNAWREFAGKPRKEITSLPPLEVLRQTEWSPTFEYLMRNRLVLGAFRYGCLHAEGRPRWDRIGRAKHELELYIEDRNSERLVDVANMMLLEFEEGTHYFESKEDGLHTKEV